MHESMLSVTDLDGWYGDSKVLHSVSFHVQAGEVVSLTGRNGAGKTSLLRALMSMLPRRRGSILVLGRETIHHPSEKVARAGMAYCPDDRGIFDSLSVLENLLLPPTIAPGGMEISEIFRLFPNLNERRHSPGKKLSGGEQQMLAIARILRTGAKLLLLDEPTEGLAPVIVSRIAEVCAELKSRGYSLLVTEQNFDFLEGIADRFYVMETGRVVDQFGQEQMHQKRPELEKSLGI